MHDGRDASRAFRVINREVVNSRHRGRRRRAGGSARGRGPPDLSGEVAAVGAGAASTAVGAARRLDGPATAAPPSASRGPASMATVVTPATTSPPRPHIVSKTGSTCVVARGTLHDPYTGKTVNIVRLVRTSTAVPIDHVVALADAWRTGAAAWTPARRLAYASTPLVLLAVDGQANEAKDDGDAAEWLPPRVGNRCRYVARQVLVKDALSALGHTG